MGAETEYTTLIAIGVVISDRQRLANWCLGSWIGLSEEVSGPMILSILKYGDKDAEVEVTSGYEGLFG
jgi:hypothetical protein